MLRPGPKGMDPYGAFVEGMDMARGTQPVTCTRFRKGDVIVETVYLELCSAVNHLKCAISRIIIQPFQLATRTSVFPPLCRRFYY